MEKRGFWAAFFSWVILLFFIIFFNHCSSQVRKIEKKKIVQTRKDKKLNRTVLILADEKSEKELGSFPWPRSLLGKILDKLHSAKLVIIGFYLNKIQNRREDSLLIWAIQKNNKVILGAKLFSKDLFAYRSTVLYGRDLPLLEGIKPEFSSDKALLPHYAVSDFARNIGFTGIKKNLSSFEPFPLVIEFHRKIYPTLPLAVLKEYLGLFRKDFYLRKNRFHIGFHSMPISYLNKYPNQYSNKIPKKFSYYDILTGNYQGDPFAGKIVIISFDFKRIKSLLVDGKRISPGILYAQRIESLIDWIEYPVEREN